MRPPTLLGILLLLTLLWSPLPANALREAVPEINEYGWKFLNWGMAMGEVRALLQARGYTLAPPPFAPQHMLAGFDKGWRPQELAASEFSTQKGGDMLATNFHDALLLFEQGRLVGVYMERSSPLHMQDSLFNAMRHRYPQGRALYQDQGRHLFQHEIGDRRIVWSARPTGFTLAFWDPALLQKHGALMPGNTDDFADSYAMSAAPGALVREDAPASEETTAAMPPLGTRWSEPVTGMEFVFLPGGCFQSEAPSLKESGGRVCVAPFWIAAQEMTRAQFAALGVPWVASNRGAAAAPTLPATGMAMVDALDATDSLRRGNAATLGGLEFSIPTEAQWEYAARAGTPYTMPWKSPDEACGIANLADQSLLAQPVENAPVEEYFPCSDTYSTSAPGGSFPPNTWGLLDMLGNTWEWCLSGPQTPVADRVAACGGSWLTGPEQAGYAARLPENQETMQGRADMGLRPVLRHVPGLSDANQTPPPAATTSQENGASQQDDSSPSGRDVRRRAVEDLM